LTGIDREIPLAPILSLLFVTKELTGQTRKKWVDVFDRQFDR